MPAETSPPTPSGAQRPIEEIAGEIVWWDPGLKEQIVFPEINYDQIDKVRGMDIIVTTTARTDEEARELLRLFNFPFPAEEQKEAA